MNDLKHVYKLSTDDYLRMLKEQRGACHLCDSLFTSELKVNVDHCHESGRVRGLLCMRCNLSLSPVEAMVKEAGLDRIARYLQLENTTVSAGA